MDNECDYFEPLISRSLDGRLSKDEDRLLKEHLSSCKSCKAFLNNATVLNKLLGMDIDLKPVPLPMLKQKTNIRLPIWLKIAACFLIVTIGSISGIKLGEGVIKVMSSEQQYVYLDDDMASLSPSDNGGLDIDEISP